MGGGLIGIDVLVFNVGDFNGAIELDLGNAALGALNLASCFFKCISNSAAISLMGLSERSNLATVSSSLRRSWT
jgi:hypothetical protein